MFSRMRPRAPSVTSTAASPSLMRSSVQPLASRRFATRVATSSVPSVVDESLESPGRPLDSSTRAVMEERFGHDFSQVRVHADGRAADAASAMDARAFTLGRDIVFGRGSWAPQTDRGLQLLAHELVHVIQQRMAFGGRTPELQMSSPDDPAEREADAVASHLSSAAVGSSTISASHAAHDVIQRQPRPGGTTGHLERNRFNLLPVGSLTPVRDADPNFTYREGGSNSYQDELGLIWELEPDWKTEFHQPEGHKESPNPYPNKKFLHRDASGGSAEAIRRPDGTYITTGPLRGTYNFTDPKGASGYVGHFLQDILPHWSRTKIPLPIPWVDPNPYVEYPPLDPGRVDVNTYRQRYEAQIEPIGERRETNLTDPVDRTMIVETGVVWITHASGEVLVLAQAIDGRLSFLRFIDSEFQAEAIAQGTARQPRGIQRIPGKPPYIFNVPTSVPPNAARR